MGKIKIKADEDVKQNFDRVMNRLAEGPVYIARNKRVKAVLMDISDYYDLLGEIEDLMEMLHAVGGCSCGCEDEDDDFDRILSSAFGESGD